MSLALACIRALCFISFVRAQLSKQQVALESVTSLKPTSGSTALAIPPSPNALAVSVALCASSSLSTRFFVTNNTQQSPADIISNGGGDGSWEIFLTDGYGNWTGSAQNGALVVFGGTDVSLEVVVSSNAQISGFADQPPFLGDTTFNEAILYSPPLAPSNAAQPLFPNYTLSGTNLSMTPPSGLAALNVSLLLFNTSGAPASGVPRTACALRAAAKSVGQVINETFWLRDADGWRQEWLVGQLLPLTNYTAYAVVNETQVSQPLFFATKSARFPCTLAHQASFCPGLSWAVNLPAPPFPLVAHTGDTLPPAVTGPLLQYLANFTVTLGTFPCGRDAYSPLQTCAACQAAYRRWLCAVQFPRCAEPPPAPAAPAPAVVAQPPGALRNPNFPNATEPSAALLPCLETCTAVDRACPHFLGFGCPVARFNAASSYGVGFIDDAEAGLEGRGTTGVAQDRYGNVWCNAG